MNQPTPLPTVKVTTGALAGALCVIAAWIAELSGLTVPPQIAAAFTMVFAALLAYVVPEAG